MKKVYIVIGTRPNFVKVTQFKQIAESKFPSIDVKLIHTGQHYDSKMADVFFEQFNLIPDYYLNISPGKPSQQIANIILKLEELCSEIGHPDMMLVVGDVNSTLAASIYANKSGIKLGHIESGLRSFDRTMPEEINRLITDEISDFYFVTEQSGIQNLIREGKKEEYIYIVGNTMIDTLVAFSDKIETTNLGTLNDVLSTDYVLMTMHRPATVDSKDGLKKLLKILKGITQYYNIVFPIHPRTFKNIEEFGLKEEMEALAKVKFVEPLGYFHFQKLVKYSALVITDSGGIQEETTFLKKPCLTLRANTERPCTCEVGTNTLLDLDYDAIIKEVEKVKSGTYKTGAIPQYWDGNATERILQKIINQ